MTWKSTLVLTIAMTVAHAVPTWAASLPGKPTSTDVCIHYVTDMYYDVPTAPLVYPNFTAQRWSYYYVCPANVNYTFCYQTPTSYPNGTYECQSNLAVDSSGAFNPGKTVALKKDSPLISAAIIVKPKVTKKYYRTCSSGDNVCNKTLFKMNKCMWQNESCVVNAGGKVLAP